MSGSEMLLGTGEEVQGMEVYIVAVGDMFDAVNFFGPFDSGDAAADWADRNAPTGWWVLKLNDPNE